MWSLWYVPVFLERWFEQAAPFRNKNDPILIFSAETETFHENYVYAMTTDVMEPRVAKPSAPVVSTLSRINISFPDSKVHGANMGPTWVLSAPDGPHFGPMRLATRVVIVVICDEVCQLPEPFQCWWMIENEINFCVSQNKFRMKPQLIIS